MTPLPVTPAARFLALADGGRNAWWRYLLGIAVIAAFWLVGGNIAFALALRLPLGIVTEFVAVNASVLMLLAGVITVVIVLHRRGWRTLVTPQPRLEWRRIAEGAVVWMALTALFAVVENLLHPGRYAWSFDPQRWLPFFCAALLLTPLQCAAEELVFRGYLVQAMGRLLRRPALLAVMGSAVFTIPHLSNPEVGAYGLAIMAANYFAMGVFLASIALRDGRLELAIGAHAGNNFMLAVFVNYEDSVFRTASMFTAGMLDPVYSLVTLTVSAAIFHLWIFRSGQARNE